MEKQVVEGNLPRSYITYICGYLSLAMVATGRERENTKVPIRWLVLILLLTTQPLTFINRQNSGKALLLFTCPPFGKEHSLLDPRSLLLLPNLACVGPHPFSSRNPCLCQPPILISKTVKHCAKSQILSYLQTNKLACECFMDTGRRHKAIESEARHFIIHRKSRSLSVCMMFVPVPLHPSPMGVMQRDHHGCLYTQWTVLQEKILSFGVHCFYNKQKGTCSLGVRQCVTQGEK